MLSAASSRSEATNTDMPSIDGFIWLAASRNAHLIVWSSRLERQIQITVACRCMVAARMQLEL